MDKQKVIISFFNKSSSTTDDVIESHGTSKKCAKSSSNSSSSLLSSPSSSHGVLSTPSRASSSRMEVTSEITKPFHPNASFDFKKTKIGQQMRSCKSQWFEAFPWLHYRPESYTVICYICANQDLKGNLISATKKETTFLSKGFRNWKKATEYFKSHQSSECHKVALTFEMTAQSCKNIVEMTNENAVKVRYDERNYLSKVMESVQFLWRQGLPFQGDFGNDNFTQLLLFRGKDDSRIAKRLLAPTNRQFKKYTHHEFQNELLDIMAKHVLTEKLAHIHASPFYALMADEYTDISNKEHVSICVRWIDPERLSVYEDFLGFYEVKNIKSETIVNAIKDVLIRSQLPLSKLRGQTYDGVSNMMGRKSGVAAKIKECQKKALETHCHGHSLNLSVKDVTSQSKTLRYNRHSR